MTDTTDKIPEVPGVTREQSKIYHDALQVLIPTAMQDTGGSYVCAQVLLGMYNGGCFHLDITDLRRLDSRHMHAAFVAIQCSVVLQYDPHHFIPDGKTVFHRLWDQWESALHIEHRYASRYAQ